MNSKTTMKNKCKRNDEEPTENKKKKRRLDPEKNFFKFNYLTSIKEKRKLPTIDQPARKKRKTDKIFSNCLITDFFNSQLNMNDNVNNSQLNDNTKRLKMDIPCPKPVSPILINANLSSKLIINPNYDINNDDNDNLMINSEHNDNNSNNDSIINSNNDDINNVKNWSKNITRDGLPNSTLNELICETAGIKKLVQESGHTIIFLPPYSPFLNPIENMFSKWKQVVRSKNVLNEDQLLRAIDDASELIDAEECGNYYRHMLGFMHRCLLKEPIYDE